MILKLPDASWILKTQNIKIVASLPFIRLSLAFSLEELAVCYPPAALRARLPRFDRVAMAYEAPEDVEGLKRTAVELTDSRSG